MAVRYVAVGGSIESGVGIAFGLFFISFLSSMSLTAMLFVTRNFGLALRSGMMMAVYEQVC